MRYLYLLLLLAFCSCQQTESPYMQAENFKPWMAFQMPPEQQSLLREMEQNRPKAAPLNDSDIIKRAFRGQLFSLEERLDELTEKCLAEWQEQYSLSISSADAYWLSYEGKWLLLIRLPSQSLQSDLFRAEKNTAELKAFTGMLDYQPSNYQAPTPGYNIPPQSIRSPMKLHFERGVSVGAQSFFREDSSLACRAYYQLKEGALKEARGPNYQEPPHLLRAGTWIFYDEEEQLLLSMHFEDGNVSAMTWPNGQTGRERLSYLRELSQGSLLAMFLLLFLLMVAYSFRQRITWKQERDTVVMGLFSWLFVQALLLLLLQQLLGDWALFSHPEANYASVGSFLLLQLFFLYRLLFVRRPQWLLFGLSGLLFFVNLSYALHAAQIGLSALLSS